MNIEQGNDQQEGAKLDDTKNETEKTRQSRGLKFALPRELEEAFSDAMNELKRRGSKASQDELIAPLFKTMTIDWLSERVEALTPTDYYFEALKEFPDARERLLEAARRAYIQEKLGGLPKKAKRAKEPSLNEATTL